MFHHAIKPIFITKKLTSNARIQDAIAQRNFNVLVAGAAGGIGQPLSLLLKQNCMITKLTLYDVAKVTPGVAADLSHMDTAVKIASFAGADKLCDAVKGNHLVVIPAGVPRKPGMTRDDLFKTNASIVRDIACAVSANAPKAIMAIITNPVNSVVPIACEVLKSQGVLDPNRVIGVTTLDVVRAAAFVGAINGIDPGTVQIPVIGGHSGVTIIPVLSQAQPKVKLTKQADIEKLTKRIQEAGTEVVKAKAGGGSATLSMAYSAARLTCAILRGLSGEADVVECGYVKSSVSEASYFANPLLFGKNGVAKNLGYGKLNAYEQKLLKAALPELKKNIATGEKFLK